MMLFDPSPGQIVDRMTILTLKRTKALANNIPVAAIDAEIARCNAVLDKFKEAHPEKVPRFNCLASLLLWRNNRQWWLEDAVRSHLKALNDPPTYDQLAEVVQIEKQNAMGNEARALLVREIDKLFGVEPELKAYS